jgi:O-antigen ligase
MAAAYSIFTEEMDLVAHIAIARAERTFEDKSSDLRTDLVLGAMEVLKGNLFMGVGPGNSNVVIHNVNPFIPDKFRATVHNIYLIVATETGVIGVVLFVALMLVPCKRVLHALRRGDAECTRDFGDNAVGFIACFVSLYFAMLWYVGMFHESEFPLIMTLIGAALGSSKQMMSRRQQQRVTGAQAAPAYALAGARV